MEQQQQNFRVYPYTRMYGVNLGFWMFQIFFQHTYTYSHFEGQRFSGHSRSP